MSGVLVPEVAVKFWHDWASHEAFERSCKMYQQTKSINSAMKMLGCCDRLGVQIFPMALGTLGAVLRGRGKKFREREMKKIWHAVADLHRSGIGSQTQMEILKWRKKVSNLNLFFDFFRVWGLTFLVF